VWCASRAGISTWHLIIASFRSDHQKGNQNIGACHLGGAHRRIHVITRYPVRSTPYGYEPVSVAENGNRIHRRQY